MAEPLVCSSCDALRDVFLQIEGETESTPSTGKFGGPAGLVLTDLTGPDDCTACCALLAGQSGTQPRPVGVDGLFRSFCDVASASLCLERCALDEGSINFLCAALRLCGGSATQAADESARSGRLPDDEAVFDLDLFGEDQADTPAESEEPAMVDPEPVSPDAGAGEEPPTSGAGMQLRFFAVRECPGVASTAWVPLWQSLPGSLNELDLSNNLLSDHAVSALCGALQQRGCCMARLVLRGNHCKDVGRLCALIEAGQLIDADLADNMLNDKSLGQFADVIAAPKARLQRLSISDNKRVSSRGIFLLAPLLERSPLQVLHVDGTSLCDSGAGALAGVLPHSSIMELWAHMTQVTSAGARALLSAARGPGQLRTLVVDDNFERVRWQRCVEVAEILKCLSYMDGLQVWP